MNIVMVTNVFTPQIGGVTRSIQQFTEEYRARGHNVLVVAPDYANNPEQEQDVIRVTSIPNFYLNQYSLPIPMLATLLPKIRDFQPDIVHAHHPFLLGTMAQTLAAECSVPLVYTHHTRYAVYIETKTNWPEPVEEAIIELITGYCSLADITIAPSQGIKSLLEQRGVECRIEVVATGVDVQRFAQGDAKRCREKFLVPNDAFVVGHCGRLSVEKNCLFLAKSIAEFLNRSPQSFGLIVGDGPERETFEKIFAETGTSDRVIMTGFLENEELIDAYAAMDVFAFASRSETQGMVLAEAMAAGSPVIALSATGVDDIIQPNQNGILVPTENQAAFVQALRSFEKLSPDDRERLKQGALSTAQDVSQGRCAERMLSLYEQLIRREDRERDSTWYGMLNTWDAAWQRWKNRSRFITTLAKETILPDKDDGPAI